MNQPTQGDAKSKDVLARIREGQPTWRHPLAWHECVYNAGMKAGRGHSGALRAAIELSGLSAAEAEVAVNAAISQLCACVEDTRPGGDRAGYLGYVCRWCRAHGRKSLREPLLTADALRTDAIG